MEQNELLKKQMISPIKALLSPLKNRENQDIFVRLETIINNLISCYFKWDAAQNRGSSLCGSIEAIKSKAIKGSERSSIDHNYYPDNLQDYCDKLDVIEEICENVVRNIAVLLKQIQSLVRLNKQSTDIFSKTWTLKNLEEKIENVYELCNKELIIKRKVTAEIAHCQKRENLFLQSKLWKYPEYADEDFKLLILFIKREVKDIIKID